MQARSVERIQGMYEGYARWLILARELTCHLSAIGTTVRGWERLPLC
jgi:hypothetical protein